MIIRARWRRTLANACCMTMHQTTWRRIEECLGDSWPASSFRPPKIDQHGDGDTWQLNSQNPRLFHIEVTLALSLKRKYSRWLGWSRASVYASESSPWLVVFLRRNNCVYTFQTKTKQIGDLHMFPRWMDSVRDDSLRLSWTCNPTKQLPVSTHSGYGSGRLLASRIEKRVNYS